MTVRDGERGPLRVDAMTVRVRTKLNRRNGPEERLVVMRTVEEKPWFVKAMGNPVVMGALTMAAARMLSNQRRKGGGGLF